MNVQMTEVPQFVPILMLIIGFVCGLLAGRNKK